MFHFSPFRYWGIDWLAMLLMLASTYALSAKRRSGFLLGAAMNVCWLVFGLMVGSIPDLIANVLCLGTNILGFQRWYSKTEEQYERLIPNIFMPFPRPIV